MMNPDITLSKAAASPTEVLSGVALTTEGAPHGACLPPCYPPCACARDSVEGLPLWSVLVGVHVVWMWPTFTATTPFKPSSLDVWSHGRI